MRISSFGKGLRITGFFRLCLGIIVSLTLTMGGMAFNTQPVQAHGITGPTPAIPALLPDCTPFAFQFGYNAPCCGACGVYFWWLSAGAPAWMNIDQNGLLTGCPPLGTVGPINVMVAVSEMSCCLWINGCPTVPGHPMGIPITLNFGPGAPACVTAINPTVIPVAWENMPFTMTLTATGGVGTLNWTATGLPPGLTVTDAVNGVISGTPAPGSCGPWNVTVACTDNGTCPSLGCCPDITAPLYLYVDCWANYLALVTTYTTTTACDFTVNIGPGLAYGTTNVVIDGNPEATLAGNGSEIFTSVPCESHLVVVDQTVQGPDPKTRYACIGSNQKWVSDIDSIAYFDYAPEIWIDTGSDPAGITQPRGAGFYAAGAGFSSSAPSPVQPGSLAGTKYVFRQWSLPDGSTNPNRDLWFTVTNAGKATALYDTYYELILTSDFPAVLEKSWEPAGSNATWKLALQPMPFTNFFGVLGGVYEPTNAEGSHNMTGPYTQEITWQENWFWPIFWIVLALLAIAAAIFFIVRSGRKRVGPDGTEGKTESSTQPCVDAPVKAAAVEVAPVEATPEKPAVSAIPEKKALPEAEQKDKPNFCPKCGSAVDEGSGFCKKCGNKL